jgi:hypothetical protein
MCATSFPFHLSSKGIKRSSVARKGSARSFGLRAALPLVKLYQSTARTVEAHDILEPTLKDTRLLVNRLRAVLHPRPQAVKQSS